MKRSSPLRALAFAALAFIPSSADASSLGIPDSDTALLSSLLFSQIKEAVDMAAMLATVQQSLETARYTSELVRSTVDVVGEFRYIAENPDTIFDAAAQGFFHAFPELEAIATDAVAIKNQLSGRHAPEGYNPYALQHLIHNLKSSHQSAYQTLIAMDEAAYGLTDEHLFSMDRLEDLRASSEAIRRETMLPLTPQAAAVLSAKASAQTAAASVEAASYQAELLRMAKQEYVRSLDASARAGSSVQQQAAGLERVTDVTEGLDPFADDPSTDPYAPAPLQ